MPSIKHRLEKLEQQSSDKKDRDLAGFFETSRKMLESYGVFVGEQPLADKVNRNAQQH